jgi:hypothetical protein
VDYPSDPPGQHFSDMGSTGTGGACSFSNGNPEANVENCTSLASPGDSCGTSTQLGGTCCCDTGQTCLAGYSSSVDGCGFCTGPYTGPVLCGTSQYGQPYTCPEGATCVPYAIPGEENYRCCM